MLTHLRWVLLVQLEWFPSMITHQARVSNFFFESCDFLVWDFQGCYSAQRAGWLSGHRIHAHALAWVGVESGIRLGESPSLVLDNWWNLCTNLCHEMWYELGWCNPSMEHGGTQSGGDDHMKWWRWPHMMMIKCSTWKRRKRKTKPYGNQGKGINRHFVSGRVWSHLG